jgi:tetratricopeptide (TPR) repeat protein
MRGFYRLRLIGFLLLLILVLPQPSLARRAKSPGLSQDRIERLDNALAVLSSSNSDILSLARELDLGNPEISIDRVKDFLSQSEDIALDIQDDVDRALSFVRIAFCYSLTRDLDSYNRAMAQVSGILHNMSRVDILNIDIDSFRDIASTMVAAYNETESSAFRGSYLQEFLTTMNGIRAYFRDNRAGIYLAQAQERVAFIYDKKGDYDKAIKYYKRAAHSYEIIAEERDDADFNYISAELSYRAAELCLKAYNIATESRADLIDGAAKSFALASHSYEKIEEWKKASESAFRSYQINRDRDDHIRATTSLLWAVVNMGRHADETGFGEDRIREAELWLIRGDYLKECGCHLNDIYAARENSRQAYQEALAALEEAEIAIKEGSYSEDLLARITELKERIL